MIADNAPWRTLDIPSRARSALCALGCRTVGDVCAMSLAKLRKVRGCGKTTIAAIVQALATHGRKLQEGPPIHDVPPPSLIAVLRAADGYSRGAAARLGVSRQYVEQLVTRYGLRDACAEMKAAAAALSAEARASEKARKSAAARAKQGADLRKRRDARKADGVCARCGKVPVSGRVNCPKCRAAHAKGDARKYQKRCAIGACVRCGGTPSQGRKHCLACLAKQATYTMEWKARTAEALRRLGGAK